MSKSKGRARNRKFMKFYEVEDMKKEKKKKNLFLFKIQRTKYREKKKEKVGGGQSKATRTNVLFNLNQGMFSRGTSNQTHVNQRRGRKEEPRKRFAC